MASTRSVQVPGRDIPTFRELVIAKQGERKYPIENKFVERMEDNLIKWRPPVSNHRGTVMAVDGLHPYQLNTDGIINSKKSKHKLNNDTTDDGIVNQKYASINESSKRVIEAVTHWLRGNGIIKKPDIPENGVTINEIRNINDQDDLSFIISSVNVTSTATPLILPSGGCGTARDLNSVRVLNPNSPLSENDVEAYQLYYNHPIPVNYLDTIRNNNKNQTDASNLNSRNAGNYNMNQSQSNHNATSIDTSPCDQCMASIFFPCLDTGLDTPSINNDT